jgi:hypothetical protein
MSSNRSLSVHNIGLLAVAAVIVSILLLAFVVY